MAHLPAFVGRESELDQIRAALEAAHRGTGSFVMVEGGPGIGKSAFVNEVVAIATGFDVHLSRANQLERDIPLALIARCLRITAQSPDERRRAIASMMVTPREEEWIDRRFQIIEEMVDLVETMALDNPLLFVVEDMQWADGTSGAALARVTERCRDLAMVVLCTARPTTADATVVHVMRAATDPVHVRLTPLDPTEVGQLASALLDAKAGPNLRRTLETAGGNPLFARELISELGREGVLERSQDGVDLTTPTLPPSLRLVILRHVSRLETGILDLLRTAAVLGTPFTIEDLAMLHDSDPMATARSIEGARRAEILVDSEEGLRFRHDVIREVIYEDMSLTARRTMHRHIARVMIDQGREARRHLTHITLGTMADDAESAEWLLTAAREIAPTSPSEAAHLFERAMDIAPATFEQRSRVEAELVTTLVWTGEPERAEARARELLRSGASLDGDSRSAVVIALVRAVMLQGKTTDLATEMQAVARDRDVSPADRALLLAEAALIASGSRAEHENAVRAAQEAVELATSYSATAARCTALCALSYVRMYEGDVDGAIAFAREAVELAHRSGDVDALRRAPNYYLACALMFVDQIEEAERLYVEGMRIAEQLGAPWSLPVYHLLLSEVHRMAGRWDDTIAECEAGVHLAGQLGTMLQVIPARTNMALAHVHRDELKKATEQLAACEALVGSAPRPYHASWARMVLLSASGDIKEAAVTGEALHREMTLSEHWFMYRLFGIDLVRTLIMGRSYPAAEEVVTVLERLVPQHPAWSPRAIAMQARALWSHDGDLALEAVEAFRKSPRVTETAWAAEDAALLIASKDRNQAIVLLGDAAASHERTRLVRDAARVNSLLRSLGVRRGSRRPKKRVTTGWDSLTRSELKISQLVAEGLSNPRVADRLFISRRTVDAHLSHVYSKLGISSRAQLAAQFAVRDGPQADPAGAPSLNGDIKNDIIQR